MGSSIDLLRFPAAACAEKPTTLPAGARVGGLDDAGLS
jgi:hypothetical protein